MKHKITPKEAALEAAQSGNCKRLLAAIRRGAPVNTRDHDDWTLLMLATVWGRLSACRLLISMGAWVNACDLSSRETAVHIAARRKHPRILRLLVKAGGDLHRRDSDGITPASYT